MGGIIGGVATIAGGIMGAGAAKSAAAQQADAIRQGLAFQQQVYGQTQGNLQPFIGTGTNALGAIAQLYGLAGPGTPGGGGGGNALNAYQAFTKTPFYQFPLGQGIEAVNRSGAARGLSLSGGQLNALQQYGQGAAASNFDKYIGGLSSLANLGQGSATALGSLGQQAAGQVLTGQTTLGNALATGTVGQSNQIKNALGGLVPLLTGSNPGATNNQSSYGGGGGLIGGIQGLFGGGGGGDLSNYAASGSDYQTAPGFSFGGG